MPRLNLSLYENAIDSIQHAIEHYTSDPDEHRRYKYAIQHLSQGVLLLLKERLRMEQPRFIYTNVAKETKTVDTDRAISRLKSIAGVDFGGRESVLRELISLRNAVEHYALDINKQQADSIIGRVVPIIAWFVETHLRRNFPRAIGEANWKALITIQDYFLNAVHGAKMRIKEADKAAYMCRDCGSLTAMEADTEPIADKWELESAPIICLVCRKRVFTKTHCRGCGTLIIDEQPITQHISYWESCKEDARRRFPEGDPEGGTIFALFATEVERWFEENDQISFEQLLKLLSNVRLMTPTAVVRYPNLLFERGYVDFVHEEDRQRHDALADFRHAYAPPFSKYDRFRWTGSTDL